MSNTQASTNAPAIETYLAIPAATTPAWLDAGRLAYLSDVTGVPQVWLTDHAGAQPQPLTAFDERIGSLIAAPRGDRLVFGMDTGANEHEQLWIVAPGQTPRALTDDPQTIHQLGTISPDGRRLAYAGNTRDKQFFDVWTLALDDPAAAPAPVLAADELLKPLAWSNDGRQLLVKRVNTNLDHDLLLVPAEGGEPDLLTPHEGEATIEKATLEEDAIYFLSNQDREFVALLRHDLATRQQTILVDAPWDVEGFAVAKGGDWLAYAVNEDGSSRLTRRNLATGEERPVTGLPNGVADGLAWSPNDDRLAFRLHGPSHPSAIWECGLDGAAHPVTTADLGALDGAFVEPEVVRYASFDGRQIPAYWYRPANGDGPWPVLVDVHGGPESQRRAEFAPLSQYLLAHGFAVLAPNVRGSSGYGKIYCHLDDVALRMDSVADLAAAVDWLRAQPDVSADRIAIYGRSYGGFMVLAAVTTYPDLWAAAVDVVGIADFATFLANTGPWRRRTRAAEYGDPERDAALLREISPIHQADRITAPMLVIHGRNDPRVPVGEAEQIVARLRALGRDVELIIHENEGHQTTRLANKITAYGAMTRFLAKRLGEPSHNRAPNKMGGAKTRARENAERQF
ncbi:MAG: alpha/beta fold hydrolase [Thermomicrobiales bacterium]